MSVKRLVTGSAVAAAAVLSLFGSAVSAETAELSPMNDVPDQSRLEAVMTEATATKRVTILVLSSRQCGPCQQLKPRIIQAANQEAGKSWIVAYHEAPRLAHTPLTRLYNLTGFPTILATGGDKADPRATCGRYSGDFGSWAGRAASSAACQRLING